MSDNSTTPEAAFELDLMLNPQGSDQIAKNAAELLWRSHEQRINNEQQRHVNLREVTDPISTINNGPMGLEITYLYRDNGEATDDDGKKCLSYRQRHEELEQGARELIESLKPAVAEKVRGIILEKRKAKEEQQ